MDLVGLHATDPASPHLGVLARVEQARVGSLDAALYEARTLWRLHAMRRTLFIVPAKDVPIVDAAVCRAVAARERARLEGWLASDVGERRAPGLLARAEERLLDVLADGEWGTKQLVEAVPEIARTVVVGSGRWSARASLGSRLLMVLAAELKVVRTRPAGSWRSSQYRWARSDTWFEALPAAVDEDEACAVLVRRYLARFGPATFDDVRWWTGWTVSRTRRALAGASPTVVRLEDGTEALVADDDREVPVSDGPHVAFLPALDPTPMGYAHRDWYLGDLAGRLFDRNGNVGPTIWVDGRVVGGWGQQRDATVVTAVLASVASDAADLIGSRAEELTTLLDGEVVVPRFRAPLERELSRGRGADDA